MLDGGDASCYTEIEMIRWFFIVLILLWIAIMWAVVVYALYRGWGPVVRSRRHPITRIGARVRARQGVQDFNPASWELELIQKVLVFECDDGVVRDYEVPDAIFDRVEVGDDGVLVYRGEMFVDFEPHRPRQDADELFKRLTR